MTVCDRGGGSKIAKNSVTSFMDGPLEGLEGRWRVTTAEERVERVGCMVRRSEMEEGLLY